MGTDAQTHQKGEYVWPTLFLNLECLQESLLLTSLEEEGGGGALFKLWLDHTFSGLPSHIARLGKKRAQRFFFQIIKVHGSSDGGGVQSKEKLTNMSPGTVSSFLNKVFS